MALYITKKKLDFHETEKNTNLTTIQDKMLDRKWKNQESKPEYRKNKEIKTEYRWRCFLSWTESGMLIPMDSGMRRINTLYVKENFRSKNGVLSRGSFRKNFGIFCWPFLSQNTWKVDFYTTKVQKKVFLEVTLGT